MVSFLRKGLEYKMEKLRYKKLGGYSAKDQNQIRTSSLTRLPTIKTSFTTENSLKSSVS